jgi:hypothetical protein
MYICFSRFSFNLLSKEIMFSINFRQTNHKIMFNFLQLDDLTADATLSNLTGVADYIEDVK